MSQEYIAAVKNADEASLAGMDRPSCLDSQTSFEAALAAIAVFGPDQCPWLTRVWTVQEAILPPDFTFLWGSTAIQKSSIEAVCSIWFRWERRKRLSLPTMSRECLGHPGGIVAELV